MGSEQQKLRELLERVGMECLHIGKYEREKKEGKRQPVKKLWWARDFNEICDSPLFVSVS